MPQYKNIEVSDWDKLVIKTYKRHYSFQQQEGCKSRGIVKITVPSDYSEDDEMHESISELINGEEMGVKFNVWLKRDAKAPLNPTNEELKSSNYYWGKNAEAEIKYKNDINHIKMFWERNFYPDVHEVINDLHKKGLLEAGKYNINIDW